ncbi:unnamed protein product [Closterium sp. Yama58-4]|nr:unnamed protein product [Closterium sp. Yama58-4]
MGSWLRNTDHLAMSESSAATATATAAGVSLKQRRIAADASQPSVTPEAGNAIKDADALKDKAKPRGASPRRRSGWLLLVLVVLVAAAAGAGYYLWREYSEFVAIDDDEEPEAEAPVEKVATRSNPRKAQWQADKLWSAEELARYNGSKKGVPLLLGILGDVFDVTKGRKHYGKGQGYNHFAGRDATRAFVSGNFSGDGLTDDLTGLSGEQCIGIADWRDFYFKTYIHVGKLVGRFYDEQGKATAALGEFDELLKEGKRLRDVAKVAEKKYPGCNSRWAQNEGGKVWCDSGMPRKIPRIPEAEGGPVGGSEDTRCACFTKEQLASRSDLQEYDGCAPDATKCVSSPPEDPNAASLGDGSEEEEEWNE